MQTIGLIRDDSGFPNTGDIFKDFVRVDVKSSEEELIEIITTFPYVIVLGQSCDMRWDAEGRMKEVASLAQRDTQSGTDEIKNSKNFNSRLMSYLIAPLHPGNLFGEGKHMLGLGWPEISTPFKKDTEKWEKDGVFSNKELRYHAFNFDKATKLTPSVVDFKHYFSVNPEEIKLAKNDGQYIGTLPYYIREQFMQRFSNYISRIGIPDIAEDAVTN